MNMVISSLQVLHLLPQSTTKTTGFLTTIKSETTSTHCEYELLLEASEASSSSSEEREFSKRTRLGIPALRSWPLYTR
jgi:hypothetical protein